MKIRDVKVTESKGKVIVSAKCKIRRFGYDEVYFKVDSRYKDFIVADASPFAAGLLLPSAKLGEDLIIDAPISAKLFKGLKKIIPTVVPWGLHLKKINIKAKHLSPDTQKARYNASFFSGGVDSFYTYLKNRKNKETSITHFILVKGFDIKIKNKKLWKVTLAHVKKVADVEGIKIIEVETNLHDLIDPIFEWDHSFAGGLAAVGLLLRKKIKRVYRASGYSKKIIKGPLDMVLDHFFETESFSMVFDGSEATRLEKIKKIAGSKLFLENVRVCYLNNKNVYNCGRCDKCLRTMIGLFLAGKLKDAVTFPGTIDLENVRSLHITNIHGAMFHKENLNELKRLGIEPSLQQAIEYALENFGERKNLKGRLINDLILLDHVYLKSNVRQVFAEFLAIKNSLSIKNFFSKENSEKQAHQGLTYQPSHSNAYKTS